MSILLVPGSGQIGNLGQTKYVQAFVKDVVAEYSQLEEVNPAPAEDHSWSFHGSGQRPVVVEVRPLEVAISKEAVMAFFGIFAYARLQSPDQVGVLLSLGDLPDDTIDSPRTVARNIRERQSGENFYVLDAAEVLAVLARQQKIAPLESITGWVRDACRCTPVRQDLLILPDRRAWLVEVEGDAHGMMILDEFGRVLTEEQLAVLPWTSLRSVAPEVVRSQLLNEKFRSVAPMTRSTLRTTSALSQEGVLAALDTHRRHRQQLDALIARARLMACPERGESTCIEFEKLTMTYFDRLAISMFEDRRAADDVAAYVAATRLVALFVSATWIHHRNSKALGDVGSFVRRAIEKSNLDAVWMRDLHVIAERIESAVFGLVSQDRTEEFKPLDVTAAFCVHLSTALGPYSEYYRTAVHHRLMPDDVPDLAGSPRFDNAWIESESQLLKIVLEAPTPRTHRLVTTNRNLLQGVLENLEDILGLLGRPLEFTRISLSVLKANFELIDCYFELESEQILQIFMGKELYGSKDVWVRELLQNAIDATLLRKVLFDEATYRPQVTIRYDKSNGVVEVHDNGIGMSPLPRAQVFLKDRPVILPIARTRGRVEAPEPHLYCNQQIWGRISFGIHGGRICNHRHQAFGG